MTAITKKYRIYFKNKNNSFSNLQELKFKMRYDINYNLIEKHINNINYLKNYSDRLAKIVDKYFNILLLTYRKKMFMQNIKPS